MNPVSEQHIVISNEKALALYPNIKVTNILDLKNGKELISFFNKASESSAENDFDIKNISVVVYTMVTVAARTHMSQFKTDKSLIIYYTDTDSIDINKPLDPKFVGDELGQMKLEFIFNEAIFLGPKMYGGEYVVYESVCGTYVVYEIVKVKGLKMPLAFKELKALLSKRSKLEISQEKWYRDISNSKFHIKEEIYILMVTDNKRVLLYNEDNIFYDTLPLKLVNGVLAD